MTGRTTWINPKGLSDGMCAALTAMVETRNAKKAAEKLGVSVSTLSAQLARARDRMGAENRLDAVLQWDRINRRTT